MKSKLYAHMYDLVSTGRLENIQGTYTPCTCHHSVMDEGLEDYDCFTVIVTTQIHMVLWLPDRHVQTLCVHFT
jgi:hypothetical protein